MPNKDFLENYPLYKKLFLVHPHTIEGLNSHYKPAINRYCKNCEYIQTYNMGCDFEVTSFPGVIRPHMLQGRSPGGFTFRIIYFCSSCKKDYVFYYVLFGEDEKKEKEQEYIMKVGQYPSWKGKMNKKLIKALGSYKEDYEKGLVCESQGYGIGAFAYYRRIVEGIIDELISSIGDLIEDDGKEKYEKAVAKAKTHQRVTDKINEIKSLLPISLRPGGQNPLDALYSALSAGIHAKTDEECLNQAGIIKQVVIYLLEQLENNKKAQGNYLNNIRLLNT